ncbi:hypothetical protein J14TS2_27190 [Bacillus sp. J14TS2]|uniref:hypothetical protein n=1 Tax=Bacillus sp. J14TS2 TaxID=2807188 RepID=UPI001B083A57|nr:hypothetical protein [Bacillus sp. J14TS2]GIN72244.1 hypothetical protein J14TS2_27190 [Bacillus sp. J14TS2]
MSQHTNEQQKEKSNEPTPNTPDKFGNLTGGQNRQNDPYDAISLSRFNSLNAGVQLKANPYCPAQYYIGQTSTFLVTKILFIP